MEISACCFDIMASFLTINELARNKAICKQFNYFLEKDTLWSNIFKERNPEEQKLLEFIPFAERKNFLQGAAKTKPFTEEKIAEIKDESVNCECLLIVNHVPQEVTFLEILTSLQKRPVGVYVSYGKTDLLTLVRANPEVFHPNLDPDFAIWRFCEYVKYRGTDGKVTYTSDFGYSVHGPAVPHPAAPPAPPAPTRPQNTGAWCLIA